MPKLSNKKITIGQLQELPVEERIKLIEPVVKANEKQFRALANAVAEATDFTKAIVPLTSSLKFPIIDFIENFKSLELPPIPDMSSVIIPKVYPLERYDPPVTISKSEWEIKKEAREAYRTELQIQVLEQQLNLYNGMLMPQYDINTGIITFLGKQIKMPLNTKLELVCRIVLKNVSNMKRKWSWDEIVEANRESLDNFTSRQIYNAVRSINEKVAIETQVKDMLLTNPISTVQLNPKFLAK